MVARDPHVEGGVKDDEAPLSAEEADRAALSIRPSWESGPNTSGGRPSDDISAMGTPRGATGLGLAGNVPPTAVPVNDDGIAGLRAVTERSELDASPVPPARPQPLRPGKTQLGLGNSAHGTEDVARNETPMTVANTPDRPRGADGSLAAMSSPPADRSAGGAEGNGTAGLNDDDDLHIPMTGGPKPWMLTTAAGVGLAALVAFVAARATRDPAAGPRAATSASATSVSEIVGKAAASGAPATVATERQTATGAATAGVAPQVSSAAPTVTPVGSEPSSVSPGGDAPTSPGKKSTVPVKVRPSPAKKSGGGIIRESPF